LAGVENPWAGYIGIDHDARLGRADPVDDP
jgi:hypothetical protein